MRGGYQPQDVATVAAGANSDMGGMPYRKPWTKHIRSRPKQR